MRNYTLQTDGTQNYVSLGTLGNLGSNLGSGFYCSFKRISTQTTRAYMGAEGSGTYVVIRLNRLGNAGITDLHIQDSSGNVLRSHTVPYNYYDGLMHDFEFFADVTNRVITIKIDGVAQQLLNDSAQQLTNLQNFTNNFFLGASNVNGANNRDNATIDNFKIGTSPTNIYAEYRMNEGVTRRNLIPNPSFESTNFWGPRTTLYKRSGSYSGEFYIDFDNGARTTHSYLNSNLPIALEAGKKYLFSGHVYIPSDSPIKQIWIGPRKWDWTGTQSQGWDLVAGQWTRIHKIIIPTETGDWRMIVADPTAPGFTGRAYWYPDDLSLVEYVDGLGKNLIVNANFNNDLIGWTYSSSYYFNELRPDSSTNKAIKFSSTAGINASAYTDFIPVEGGQLYELSGYIYKKNGYIGTAALDIIEYNENYTQTTNWTETLNTANFDVFEKAYSAYVLREDTKYVRVRIINYASPNGEVWFDDLFFGKVVVPSYFDGTTLPNGAWEGTPHQSISQLGLTDSTGNGNTGILKGNPLPVYVERPIIKNYNGIPEAQVKTRNGVPYSQIKSVNGYVG